MEQTAVIVYAREKCVRHLDPADLSQTSNQCKTHPFTRFVYALGELKLPIFGFVGLECLFYVPVKVNPDLPNPRLRLGLVLDGIQNLIFSPGQRN